MKATASTETKPTAQHTPGPWGWYAEDRSMAILCGYTANGHLDPLEHHVLAVTICKSCQGDRKHWEWGRCYTANAANARLIAAAPELLAAAKKMLAHLDARLDVAIAAEMPVPLFDGIADLHDAIGHAEGHAAEPELASSERPEGTSKSSDAAA